MTTTFPDEVLDDTDIVPAPGCMLCSRCWPDPPEGSVVITLCGKKTRVGQIGFVSGVDQVPCPFCRAIDVCSRCGEKVWD